MSEHLKALDTGLLHIEDADQHAHLGMGVVAVLDGPIPDQGALVALLGQRLATCPRFAQRLRRQVLDLTAPQWVPDEDFCLDRHIGRISVPGRGDDADLCAMVAEVMSWRLDRDRPLWEIWVLEGLSGDRWAMLVKVHPCIADSDGLAHILAGLSDHGCAHDATVPDCQPVDGQIRASSPRRAGWRGLLHAAASTAVDAMIGVAQAEQLLDGVSKYAAGLLRPMSALTGPLTSRRHYTVARVDAAAMDTICRSFHVTVDDVALAALTESYRNTLIRHGAWPPPEALRTLIPIRNSVLLPRLPLDQDDPVLRLKILHTRLAQARAVDVGRALAAVAHAIPAPLTAWATDLLARLPQHGVVAVTAAMPGPRRPLRIAGCAVSEVLPIPPLALQVRTGAAILRYANSVFFGILTDHDSIAAADELARGVETAVHRLLVRSRRPQRPVRDRHGLALVLSP